MEQILSIVAHNRPGVLMRVAGLISRRGYNIDSLAGGTTQDGEYSRMTITMQADEPTIVQVCKQLAKISEIERIKVLRRDNSSIRSMILVKVRTSENQMEILQLAGVFRAHAIDVSGGSLTFVTTGDEGKLRAFVNAMRKYGVAEMVQTGIVALERGDEALDVKASRYEWPHMEA